MLLDREYRIDIPVENQLIVELKRVEELRGFHEAPLLTCRELAGMKIGSLMNSNVTELKDSIKHFVLRFLRVLRVLRGERRDADPRAERRAVARNENRGAPRQQNRSPISHKNVRQQPFF